MCAWPAWSSKCSTRTAMKTDRWPLRHLRGILITVGVLLCMAHNACAHLQSTAFLTLKSDHAVLIGEWQLSIRDLEDVVGIDNNQDGVITWGELTAQKEAVSA